MADHDAERPASITAGHFFAGTIGLALIRHWYQDGDRNDARLAELRDLLDRLDEFPNSLVVNPIERDLLAGHAEWADEYDGPNPLIEAEEPVVRLGDPTGAIGELGRVLAPGGHLVISDPHPMGSSIIGGQAFYGGIVPGEPMRWVRNHFHGASTWLRAFEQAELDVDTCLELPFTESQIASTPAMAIYPDAVRSCLDGLVSLWVWVVRARQRSTR